VRNAIFRIDKGNLTMKKVGVLIGLVLLVVVLSLMHVLVDSRTATAQQGVVRQKDESSRNAGNRNILKLEVMNKKPN
jgi:hypothetical protein